MGGRGASSGISKKRNVYGSQFHAVKDSNGKALESVEKVWHDYLSRRQFRLAEQVDRQGIGSIPVDC